MRIHKRILLKLMLQRSNQASVFLAVVCFSMIALLLLQYHLNGNETTTEETVKYIHETVVTRLPLTFTPNQTALEERVLDECLSNPKNLKRSIDVDIGILNSTEPNMENVTSGGSYKPKVCVSRHRVAVIIPYKDRENHLRILLRHLHPFLQRQNIDYRIYVVEPINGVKFNRALLLNIGFVEASQLYNHTCFIFHDVDLLPENNGIPYTCDQSPLHLSVAIDEKKYRLPYPSYFGGVCSFTKEHFEAINGFSNIYFDWGGEDDDLHERVKYAHMKINRLSPEIGRYKMLQHGPAKANPDKFLLFKTMRDRYQSDGLNSLKYRVVKQELKRLYTRILVSVNETEIIESEPIHKKAFVPKV